MQISFDSMVRGHLKMKPPPPHKDPFPTSLYGASLQTAPIIFFHLLSLTNIHEQITHNNKNIPKVFLELQYKKFLKKWSDAIISNVFPDVAMTLIMHYIAYCCVINSDFQIHIISEGLPPHGSQHSDGWGSEPYLTRGEGEGLLQ